MPSLSAKEIRNHAQKAGFSGNDLDVAVAVAIAESGGDPKSYNGTGRDDSYGLWQINMYKDMGPSRRKQFGITRNEELFNPDVNARAAYMVFKSQGWNRGWTTYGTERYDKILKSIKDGTINTVDEAKGILADKVADWETGSTNPLTAVPRAIDAFGQTLFKTTTNLSGILIAVALLAVGVVLLIMSSKTAKNAVSLAANVVPGGQAVKGAVKKAVKP